MKKEPNFSDEERNFLKAFEAELTKSSLPVMLQQQLVKDVIARLADDDEATKEQVTRIVNDGAQAYIQQLAQHTQWLREKLQRADPRFNNAWPDSGTSIPFQMMSAVDNLKKLNAAQENEAAERMAIEVERPQVMKVITDSNLPKSRQ